jgi:hypothetical protein
MSVSSQVVHNQAVADETPSWDGIAYALRLLLCDFSIDLSRVGTTQRLQYEDFEIIFYHLFVLIDPNETKRRFRLICAARNQEEKTKFIESSARFINDKQLHPQRVSTNQLRMFGGEPFRRLMRSLIKAASERELERHEPSIEEQVDLQQCNNNLERLLDHLNEKSNSISSTMLELNQSMEHLRETRKSLDDSNQAIQDKWLMMSEKLALDDHLSPIEDSSIQLAKCESSISGCSNISNSNSSGRRDVSPIVRALLERLGASHSRTKSAIDRIKSIELPKEETLAPGESANKKRLSQFIREVAIKFEPSHELLSDAQQTRLNEQVKQQLIDYDQGVERLIEIWREEENRVDKELLQMANMRELFAKLEDLIPKIDITPIAPDRKEINHEVKVCDIEKILKDYPDSRYDDQEIGEITKKHFH